MTEGSPQNPFGKSIKEIAKDVFGEARTLAKEVPNVLRVLRGSSAYRMLMEPVGSSKQDKWTAEVSKKAHRYFQYSSGKEGDDKTFEPGFSPKVFRDERRFKFNVVALPMEGAALVFVDDFDKEGAYAVVASADGDEPAQYFRQVSEGDKKNWVGVSIDDANVKQDLRVYYGAFKRALYYPQDHGDINPTDIEGIRSLLRVSS